ncbi:hypothetical protein GW17_00015134 [Ensete ventricosum]|nr:hypothetical protein GW17_00015134 [Ensete ventricosum]
MRKNNEVDKMNSSHHHHHGHLWPSLSFQLHMPHLGHDKEKAGMPPKGCMVMWVGQEGEEQLRFVVPVVYLNHPLFAKLLEEAEKEYGFDQKGAIVIPCGVDHFRHVQDLIDREGGVAGAAPAAGHSRRHNDQHQHQQNHHSHRQVINDHENERACAAAAAAAGGHRHGDHHHHRQHIHHHLPHFAACFGA